MSELWDQIAKSMQQQQSEDEAKVKRLTDEKLAKPRTFSQITSVFREIAENFEPYLHSPVHRLDQGPDWIGLAWGNKLGLTEKERILLRSKYAYEARKLGVRDDPESIVAYDYHGIGAGPTGTKAVFLIVGYHIVDKEYNIHDWRIQDYGAIPISSVCNDSTKGQISRIIASALLNPQYFYKLFKSGEDYSLPWEPSERMEDVPKLGEPLSPSPYEPAGWIG